MISRERASMPNHQQPQQQPNLPFNPENPKTFKHDAGAGIKTPVDWLPAYFVARKRGNNSAGDDDAPHLLACTVSGFRSDTSYTLSYR